MSRKPAKKTEVLAIFTLTSEPEETYRLLLKRKEVKAWRNHTCDVCNGEIKARQVHDAYIFELEPGGYFEFDFQLNRVLRMCCPHCTERGETAMGEFLDHCPKEIIVRLQSSIISEELRKAGFWAE